MEKVDYRKQLKVLYGPSAKAVSLVDVPPLGFLMIDGMGEPGTAPGFQEALGVLYPVSYTLKFAVRAAHDIDYGVLPLEGLWWADDMADFVNGNKDRWQWTLMIMQPEMVTPAMVEDAIARVRRKKNPPGLDRLRFESFAEGRSAQILHIGPFDEEGPTIARVHEFIEQSGGRLSGKHHEIYLSDLRRAAPARLRTIVRQPFESV